MNPDTTATAAPAQVPEPTDQNLTWKFTTPPRADLRAIAAALETLGARFDPESDQLELGWDISGYALAADHASIRDALLEANELAGNPRPPALPRWAEMTYAERRQVLAFMAGSATWAVDNDLRDYAEDIINEHGGKDVLFD